MNIREFSMLGNVPLSASMVGACFPRAKDPTKKVADMALSGLLVRLRRGLYVANPELTGREVSLGLLAAHICSPSYVSMFTALRLYGLTPEMVYATQSVTVKAACTFDNSFGRFEYITASPQVFPIGVRQEQEGNATFAMATPAKALIDLVAHERGISLRYLTDARHYLEDYLRFDTSRLGEIDAHILQQYIDAGGKKKESIATLLKFIQR